ncbi:hypothetical protein BGX21_010212, partial [Mortierella sp. AD011]
MAIPNQWTDEDNVTKSQEIETAATINIADSSSLELKSADNSVVFDDASGNDPAVNRPTPEEIGVFDSSVSHVPAAMNGIKEQESTQSLKLKMENNRENGSPKTSGEMALPDSSGIIKPERNVYKILPISEGTGDERKIDHELQLRIDYWGKALAGAPVLLGLPTDRPRTTQQSVAYSHLPIRFDVQLTQLLKGLAQTHDVDLPVVILSAWSAILARLTSQDDIVVGHYDLVIAPHVTCANHQNRNTSPFTSLLPLRMDLSGDPTTAQLLGRVNQTILAARTHQDITFENIVEIMKSSKEDNAALFQVAFSYRGHGYDSNATETMETLANSAAAGSELELHLQDIGGEIIGNMRYSTALFDSTTIERYIGYLSAMLNGMTSNTNQSFAVIEILSPEERRLQLETWNAMSFPYPESLTIHQLFEEQVERSPQAIALVHEDQLMTYAELNSRANYLAHQLIELGVQPDMLVAICAERSPAIVIGILAILKAGGAYVPLDPLYQSGRLVDILQDANPAIMLVDRFGRATLGQDALCSMAVVDMDTLLDHRSNNLRVFGLTSRHLAYVIYTSGSTGKPKGVMVEHAQVARLFDATASWYHFNERDTWCMFHSFSFDVSVWEMWGALLHGGKLVLVSHHIAKSPQDFYHLVCEQGITVLNLTPSAFSPLIDCYTQGGMSSNLRYIILAGEALAPAMLKPWYNAHSEHGPQVVNMYGTTETTVHASYRKIKPSDCIEASSPIGVRIPDLKIYVLSANSQPVPLGAVGELYIGGAGVTRGYLNRPELTAERFLPDPFAVDTGARMYRTGDLARYFPDGNLMYLGRNDHQVKIRGFRIELGEIEAQLIEHPVVSEAVVIALGEETDKRLVAYVVARPDEQLANSLRSHLMERLPEYMIPAAY